MTGYNHNNVYHSARPMSIADAIRVAPTIAAEAAHSDRSERYGYVNTVEVLEKLMERGLTIHGVTSATVRKADKVGFEKHLIRLRRPEDGAIRGTAREILLLNSHDGSTCYEVMSGAFRFACANGLVMGDTYTRHKVKHSRSAIHEIEDATFEVLKDFERIADSVSTMSNIKLLTDEREAFADAAMTIRFPTKDSDEMPFDPSRLLRPRRADDIGEDLWTTFNVVQENCTRGGIKGVAPLQPGKRRRRMSTKDVNGIDQSTALNRALHGLAEAMAKLKNDERQAIAA